MAASIGSEEISKLKSLCFIRFLHIELLFMSQEIHKGSKRMGGIISSLSNWSSFGDLDSQKKKGRKDLSC